MLNNHTYYSFRFGTFSEEELLRQAQHKGYDCIAITDINNTSACLNFVRLAPSYGIRPILGIDFRVAAQQQFVGVAHNNEGFQELNTFLSHHGHHKLNLPSEAPDFEHVSVIYPLERVLENDKVDFKPNEYIGIRHQELTKIRFSGLFHLQDRIVAMQPVTFRSKRDFNIHRLLRAVDNNTLLSKLPQEEQAQPDEIMMPRDELKRKFSDFAFIWSNTEALMERCRIAFDFSKNRKSQNKATYLGNLHDDNAMLRDLCRQGLNYRYATVTQKIKDRLHKELKIIEQMDFVPFFLINWDIVRYAKSKGYYHVGRGSGANSIVAYLLGITDVDPIELDLYFERFMNLFRANPPDFDIDFSSGDRNDVTRYIFEKHGGRGQVALLASYNTFQHSAAMRELGKVFGLPKHEIDVLSSGKYDPRRLDDLSLLTHRYAGYIQGMPNHLSIHAGGVLISERPIHYFTATDLPPKGFPTTHFDMVIAEDVGLYKYDILGQRGLGKIKDAMALVKENHPDAPDVDIHNVKPFIEDDKINTMVSKAECIGCFYVESPAMRMLLKKLEVDSYLGLVAASSIIRPGVSSSGMMHEYIRRHKDPERRKQAHPILWDIMEDTYGIMVYQEDVIKVAHYYGGLDLAEADVLRRGMSGKFRSREEFQKVKDKFFDNCAVKGYDPKDIAEIWKQIESFAGYAFAKGHSASYAVESYQSLYLKCYYPLEYMVATINNGGGFYRVETYVHEAKMKGGNVLAPDVNRSMYETTIDGTDIYLGFHLLRSLDARTAMRIVQERERNGPYHSLENFINRVPIGIEQLDILIRINAFRFTRNNKRKLLWRAHYLMGGQPKYKQKLLFEPSSRSFELPNLPLESLENTFDEMELLGFGLGSPFDLLSQSASDGVMSKDLRHRIGKRVLVYGYLVTIKNTRTSKKERMHFGTFLDREGNWIDTVHFPPVARRFPFRGRGIYRLVGRVLEDFGCISIEIESMEKMPVVQDPRYTVD